MANLTRRQIHDLCVTELMARLSLCGMQRLPDGVDIVGPIPEFSFQHRPRFRIDAEERHFPRDLLFRLDGVEASLKVFGSRAGLMMSSLYRSIAYAAFSNEIYLQVLVGYDEAELARWLKWVSITQFPTINTQEPTGVRTAQELLTTICKARRLPVEKAAIRPPLNVEKLLEKHGQLVLPFNASTTQRKVK